MLYNPLVPIERGSRILWTIANLGTVVFCDRLNRRAAGRARLGAHLCTTFQKVIEEELKK